MEITFLGTEAANNLAQAQIFPLNISREGFIVEKKKISLPGGIELMQAVILAAGSGSRLGPITETRSKGMLPVLGRPIVELIIERLVGIGIREFILVVSPGDDAIRVHFQDHANQQVKIQFVDQDERLGSAHALRQAAPYINEDFVLSACDILVPVEDLQRLVAAWHQPPKPSGILSLENIPIAHSWKTGIVTLEGDRITSIIEKPAPNRAPSSISSMPLYCFATRFLDYLPGVPLSVRGEYELQDAMQAMINEGHLVRGVYLEKRFNLTDGEDLLMINLHFLGNALEEGTIEAKQIGPGTQLVEPLYIEAGVTIGSNCRIGPLVYIESNAYIGDNVHLESTVVLRDAAVPSGTSMQDQVWHVKELT